MFHCVQWGSEYRHHLNSGNIWIPNFLKFRFQMVSLCAIMSFVRDRPFKYQTSICIRKQDGVHLSGQMVGLYGIWMTIWVTTSFQPFEYPTSLVFRSSLYIRKVIYIKIKITICGTVSGQLNASTHCRLRVCNLDFDEPESLIVSRSQFNKSFNAVFYWNENAKTLFLHVKCHFIAKKYWATCCQFNHFCCPYWHFSCPFWCL